MKKFISVLLVCGSLLYAGTGTEDIDFRNALSELEQQESDFETFFAAAKSGDVDAQMILGEMYLDGIGVEADHQKAFFWLSKAARNGDAQAQYLLGFMYENGLKVASNIKRAIKWYTEAALQGDILAQYNLAIIYKEGKGEVEKDMKKAFMWLAQVQESRKKMELVATN
jgi:TPR repeat protein